MPPQKNQRSGAPVTNYTSCKKVYRARATAKPLPTPPLTPKVHRRPQAYRRPVTHFPEGQVCDSAAVLNAIIHRCFMSLADPLVSKYLLLYAKKLNIGYETAEYLNAQPPSTNNTQQLAEKYEFLVNSIRAMQAEFQQLKQLLWIIPDGPNKEQLNCELARLRVLNDNYLGVKGLVVFAIRMSRGDAFFDQWMEIWKRVKNEKWAQDAYKMHPDALNKTVVANLTDSMMAEDSVGERGEF